MTHAIHRARLGALVIIAAGLAAALPLTAERFRSQAATAANVTVNPALFKELYYRPLTVFARGGRVTAVAGVPSNQQLYYMGTAGGVWRTTNAGRALGADH